ncbi:MAG: ATP-binding cassette domain-containing protein [Clostridiales bacterium]|nr:ATP-binding cassette domain-containing protein [Clostridiales bacterium]
MFCGGFKLSRIIQTKGLTKTYRRFKKEAGLKGSVKSLFKRQFVSKTAVSDFDLAMEAGEFVGLIGPNGAGKTTLVKMLTGIIAPTSGEISVLGYCPNKLENAFKKQYAVVMGQKSQLIYDMTAADTFLLFKEMYEIPDAAYRRNLEMFIGLFGAGEYLNTQARTLSLGERMKMELVAALLHNPKVLFLDEPTIGLDAPAQRQIRAFLKEVNSLNGTTILLTSHYMDDIRSLCPRSVVLSGGRKIYDGRTDALFASYQTHKKVTAQFESETAFAAPPGCTLLESDSHKAVFMVPKEESGAVLERTMREYRLKDISVEEEDVGAVVEKIYQSRGGAGQCGAGQGEAGESETGQGETGQGGAGI